MNKEHILAEIREIEQIVAAWQVIHDAQVAGIRQVAGMLAQVRQGMESTDRRQVDRRSRARTKKPDRRKT